MTAPIEVRDAGAVASVDDGGSFAFLRRQVAGLHPFDFLIVNAAGALLDAIEIIRDEDSALRIAIPPRPPSIAFDEQQSAALRALGFTPAGRPAGAPDRSPMSSTPWEVRLVDDDAAAHVAARVMDALFGATDALDVHHGSRRAEHEAEQKLAALRARLVPLLTGLLGRPPTEDPDGDYVFRHQSATVFVAPRAAPNGIVVLRVFAVTNVGVTVGPELAMFLARLNFSLAFGRFTLDVEHQAVWFDETLLGDKADDDELRFAIEIVASTAAEWDDRIKAMFGGSTGEDVTASKTQGLAPPPKPGEGGYL